MKTRGLALTFLLTLFSFVILPASCGTTQSGGGTGSEPADGGGNLQTGNNSGAGVAVNGDGGPAEKASEQMAGPAISGDPEANAIAAASHDAKLPPLPAKPVYRDAGLSAETRARDLLSYMTLTEKLGQLIQVDKAFLKDLSDIASYYMGSLLSGGGSAPQTNTPSAWADMTERFQKVALSTRLGIPLIYGIDAVHGHNNVKGATIFPHNIGLGATRNAALVEAIAHATAIEVAATGIDWTFAPVVAAPQDIRWGRTYEGYSEDTALAGLLGVAAVKGFQGADPSRDLSKPDRILATAKHFIADGGTMGGVDQGNAPHTEAELRRLFLPPYADAIKAGAGSVMASFSSWRGLKMHANKYLLTDVLKGELGFREFVVSDWAALDQIQARTPSEKIAIALNAGIDMVMVPEHYRDFSVRLKDEVTKGHIPLSRIDDAVYRILVAKFRLGLFEHPFAYRELLAKVGSTEHRAIARQAVRESLVLLKNEGGFLPLKKQGLRILVTGPGADDIGMQSGGWTISWQGSKGAITPGTTVLHAIRNAVGDSSSVIFSDDADGVRPGQFDVAILVAGEGPYAEGRGDKYNPRFGLYDDNILDTLRDANIPTVTVLLSGRPLVLGESLDKSRAFVAAWLPGTEGGGIADVLFGDYKPGGKLPFTWPESIDAIPVHSRDPATPGVQFPLGFGLTY